MEQTSCTITSNIEVMPGIHLMWIDAAAIARSVLPGQFITVRCGDFTLRRPFSVHQVGSNNVIASPDAIMTKQSQIAFLFKVAGKGTHWLSQRQTGETIDILGPLGKGFNIPSVIVRQPKHLLLVAGGIGIAPLVFLAQHASSQHQITLIHGASTAAQLYLERCQLTAISYQGVQFIPVTEDGSMGNKGMATDILPDFLDWVDQVYACGPVDMYKSISLTANSRQLAAKKCQVSLEVRMGCGFGACYGCTINTKKGPKKVCHDGPVFELDDIIWQDVRL